jgi:hypothetical protein
MERVESGNGYSTMPYLDRNNVAARLLIALHPSLADRPASSNLKTVARDDDFREAE